MLERNPAPATPEPLLEHFPDGLTTAEVAALLADGPDPIPDIERAERVLLDLAASGSAVRTPLGQDAIWRGVRSDAAEARSETATALA